MFKISRFFDRLEDKVRGALSKRPITYTFIGGVAVVLFWRGVWMIADEFEFLNGWVSLGLSTLILLITGLFVSFFIGDSIIISGLRREKKLTEKTEIEVSAEGATLREVKSELKAIGDQLEHLEHIENKLGSEE